MSFEEFLQAAKVLKETDLNIRPIFETEEPLGQDQICTLAELNAAVQTGNARLIQTCREQGLEDLYFNCGDCTDDELASLHGQCRYILDCKAQLKHLDRVVTPFLKPGYLETVGIRLRNGSAETDFTPHNIPEFSRWIRFSQNLAVRGIFVEPEGTLSEGAKASFSLIKKIRSDMPCLFSYFCFEGLLQPVANGDQELLRSLEILTALNDTSFYAGFYIK